MTCQDQQVSLTRSLLHSQFSESMGDYFSMVSINIQSIKNITDRISLFLENLQLPSLVAVTEQWLRVSEPLLITNYTTIARYDRLNSTHGGTLILSNKKDFTSGTIFYYPKITLNILSLIINILIYTHYHIDRLYIIYTHI